MISSSKKLQKFYDTYNNMLYFLNRSNFFFENKSNIENFWQLVGHMIQAWCASWAIIPVWALFSSEVFSCSGLIRLAASKILQ